MLLVERFWIAVTRIIGVLPFYSFHDGGQNPLQIPPPADGGLKTINNNFDKGPAFRPPGLPADNLFQCEYPEMVGWQLCSSPSNRQCWLQNTMDGSTYNITTDYENDMPIGVNRTYALQLDEGSWDADGINFPFAKLFNDTYPGPWIQACWGDT